MKFLVIHCKKSSRPTSVKLCRINAVWSRTVHLCGIHFFCCHLSGCGVSRWMHGLLVLEPNSLVKPWLISSVKQAISIHTLAKKGTWSVYWSSRWAKWLLLRKAVFLLFLICLGMLLLDLIRSNHVVRILLMLAHLVLWMVVEWLLSYSVLEVRLILV